MCREPIERCVGSLSNDVWGAYQTVWGAYETMCSEPNKRCVCATVTVVINGCEQQGEVRCKLLTAVLRCL